MGNKKKILIFSPPFSGHLNVLKSLVGELGGEFAFRAVITGWKNIRPDMKGIGCGTEILAESALIETDPAVWTLPRVSELLGGSLRVTKRFGPDLIIYDYFSLEACFAGKLLGVPAFCSIPALMGPNPKGGYLKAKLSLRANREARDRIEKKHNVRIEEKDLEIISDGLHIPAENNLVWSYPEITPKNFMSGRKRAGYFFIGNMRAEKEINPKRRRGRKVIYFSFGTVVMDNLWRRQAETRRGLKEFIGRLASIWKNKPYRIIFVSRGKKVLGGYPANWRVVGDADQLKALAAADLFITHGGSNSFHEAVNHKVPMIVVPFFGDQPLVGEQVERLGAGVCLVKDKNIDTGKSKDFLNAGLAEKLAESAERILGDESFYENLRNLKLTKFPAEKLIRRALSPRSAGRAFI